MGAYLTTPKTDKISTDELNEYLVVGASSMQGWRNSQEDAHNAILDFDKNAAFFAVYDGHGGAEVSTYCADKLPAFLKALSSYKDGDFAKALKETFLGFDKSLLEPEVIEILNVLAGEKNGMQDGAADVLESDEDEDLAELHEEGCLPLDEVMEKYKGHPSMPTLKKLKDSAAAGSKPQSPYLRGRRAAAVIADAANKAVLDPEAKPEGSSTSRAALAAMEDAGPSSSKSSSSSKMETEEDSTVSSSSSSASKSNAAINSTSNAEAEPSSSKTNGNSITITSTEEPATKDTEHNGNVVSSSEIKANKKTEAIVSGSSDTSKADADDDHKQNGNVESSKKAAIKKDANSSIITSTSKEQKANKAKKAEEDEDVDFDANESSARQALEYSSEDEEEEDDDDEELGEEDSTDEDADADYDDEDDDVEEGEEDIEEEEDEEDYFANQQFCANMIEEPGKDSGCTAVVGFLSGRDLYVANAGDSRCVVCRNGKAIEMSLDHKPEDDEESSRILKAGGRVTLDGRVNGGLNLSRALGDHAYKMNADLPAEEQMISALPDIKKLIISPEDEFMVLACDGIWNFMSSEEVVDFVRIRLKDDTKKMSKICEELFDHCLAPNTLGDGTGCDNMTAVIVRFKPSILELPTKISPQESEDILEVKAKAQKRSASPNNSDDDDEGNVDASEMENKTKRIKTDAAVASKAANITTTSSAISSSESRQNKISETAAADTNEAKSTET